MLVQEEKNVWLMAYCAVLSAENNRQRDPKVEADQAVEDFKNRFYNYDTK